MSSLMSTYARQAVVFERGEGATLWDSNGKEYLDALGGIAVCALGHAHPEVTAAITDQAEKLIHTSNIYRIAEQEKLGEQLCNIAEMERVFFCNSGAEANEAAIKMARLHARKRKVARPEIIVMENSFHGRTMATLSATGNRKIQAGFEPLVQGFIRAPYNDIEAITKIAHNSKNVVAVLLEPIQGEGGINVPDERYLSQVRELCDKHGWLMILDEIQTGMGRTGKWFAWQHTHAKPDIITVAKALGNGIPIGATMACGSAADLLQPGTHGSTFGGNPFACRVGRAVIDIIQKESLVMRANELGTQLIEGLEQRIGQQSGVKEIRGLGLMIGIELETECTALVSAALEAGLLINVTAGSTIRLLPPLILTDTQAAHIIETLSQLVTEFLARP
ncbi:MAG: acetylornithine transaminase [Gammaproteobacteria bacterium]|nr:acetylornithine transaminase [Gammaproteobacteria bacterium]